MLCISASNSYVGLATVRYPLTASALIAEAASLIGKVLLEFTQLHYTNTKSLANEFSKILIFEG